MRLVIQRVSAASVKVNQSTIGSIRKGLAVFIGIGQEDTEADANYLIDKLLGLRIFPDASGIVADVQVFIPFLDDLEKRNRDVGFLRMIGRLRRGAGWGAGGMGAGAAAGGPASIAPRRRSALKLSTDTSWNRLVSGRSR